MPMCATTIHLNGLYKTYLMTAANDGQTKIGRSRNPTARRLSIGLEIRRMYVCDADIEHFLHEVCISKRKTGEWYELTEAEIQYIVQKYDFYPVAVEIWQPPTREEMQLYVKRSSRSDAYHAQKEFEQISELQ